MAGSLNKVQLIGRLGADPEIKQMVNGKSVARLSIATSQSWKDKSSGEKKEKTEWHRVVIFNEGLVNVVQQYLKKGANVYIEGQLSTRKWKDESSGQDKYSTEVVLQSYNSSLTMLDSRNSKNSSNSSRTSKTTMRTTRTTKRTTTRRTTTTTRTTSYNADAYDWRLGGSPAGKSFRFFRACARARRGEAARASERRCGLCS